MPARRIFPALFVALLGLPACGDDSSTPPDDTIHFPGDAASLQEAIDSAQPGETVLVGAGTHQILATITVAAASDGITIRGATSTARGVTVRPRLEFLVTADQEDAIVVEGQDVRIEGLEIDGFYRMGVTFRSLGGTLENCKIVGATSYAVWCPDVFGDALITRNLLIDAGVFGVASQTGAHPTIDRNTIVDAHDCGIYSSNASPVCTSNIIAGSDNFGVACFGDPLPALSCNNLFESTTSHYNANCIPGTDDVLDSDPLFCDTIEYTLMSDSPCTPANAPECGGIGASRVVCE